MQRVQIYDQIAAVLSQKFSQLTGDQQHWIGLAGSPGSGKSTLAAALKERLGPWLTVIPLDGFHYSRSELSNMNDPEEAFARRGAPFTFNAAKFVNTLIKARSEGQGSFPSFDHNVGDPVEDTIILRKEAQIVLVEGNYLLLEDVPWSRIQKLVFDETWYLDVPPAVCNQRVFDRHVQTGMTEEDARFRVENNDSKNAKLISMQSPGNADRIL